MPYGDNVPVALTNAIQQKYLKAAFELPLTGKRAYSAFAIDEPVPANKGTSLTLTRKSGLAPKSAPINQATKASDLKNGLTADVMSIEQYTLNMDEYAGLMELNLLDDELTIVKNAGNYARAQGDQYLSSMEGLARQRLLDAGMAGNSRVRSGSLSTTTCQVDDVRGFQFVLVNGVKTAVSGSTPLVVNEIASTGGGVTQALSVTGVTVDGSNVSSAAAVGGKSGVLTFATATTPVDGDILVAANASEMVRPNGRKATHLLNAQDVFSTAVAADMAVVLDNNGTPRFDGDYFVCFVSPRSHRQLLADPSFEKAYTGQYNSDPMRKGVITEHQGILYVKTNFALRQASGALVAVNVERPIMIGKECLVRGVFKGLAEFAARLSQSDVHEVEFTNNAVFAVRDALDALGQYITMTWETVVDFVCPSDNGTTNSIIPTANAALYKRICIAEHAA